MKAAIVVVFALCASVGSAADSLAGIFDGTEDVYLHVNLERTNGVDIRAMTIPKGVIEKAEREGKQVRPTRASNYVSSYWALLTNGDFKTFEKYNYSNPSVRDPVLSYEELEETFRSVAPSDAKWGRTDVLSVGSVRFSVRELDADDVATGGKKGEIEVAWLRGEEKVYYYFCTAIEKPSRSRLQPAPAGTRAVPAADPRLVGSWKFTTEDGFVLFHTSFANGDFQRSKYADGKCILQAKGRWTSDGRVFHIVILERNTNPQLEKWDNVEGHFDQPIVEMGPDWYVVREPSMPNGFIKWVRIGGSDPKDLKSDGPSQ